MLSSTMWWASSHNKELSCTIAPSHSSWNLCATLPSCRRRRRRSSSSSLSSHANTQTHTRCRTLMGQVSTTSEPHPGSGVTDAQMSIVWPPIYSRIRAKSVFKQSVSVGCSCSYSIQSPVQQPHENAQCVIRINQHFIYANNAGVACALQFCKWKLFKILWNTYIHFHIWLCRGDEEKKTT